MATFDYAEIADTVEELFVEFGFTTTLRKSTAGGSEFAPTLSASDTNLQILDTDVVTRAIGGDGNFVSATERVIYASTAGTAPAKDDKILLDGKYVRIAESKPLKPGNVMLLFELKIDG